MCPACMTSIALMAAGGTTGGLTVLAMTKLLAKTIAKESPRESDLKEESL